MVDYSLERHRPALDGQVALVTGAAGGIGRATVPRSPRPAPA